MGFLSKLFGGDAGPASGNKASDQPASASTELESSVAVRNPANTAEPAPPRADTPKRTSLAEPPPRAEPPQRAEPPPRAERPQRAEPPQRPEKVAMPASDKSAPAASAATATTVERQAVSTAESPTKPSDVNPARALVREPVSTSTEAAKSSVVRTPERQVPPSATAATPPSSLAVNEPAGLGTPRKGADVPRRAPALESSIITSAPALNEIQRAAAAPRPALGAKAPKPPAAEPPPARERNEPRDPGLISGARRKDRTKSPGFYSNMAPAHGAHTVSSALSQANLKRTVVGVAPPPEAPVATPGEDATGAAAANGAASPETSVGAARARTADASAAAHAALLDVLDAACPPDPKSAPIVTAASGAPATLASDAEEEEKEDTSPGLGVTRSRHDPAVRLDLPEGDLELLVDFVMDLGLGLAQDSWLSPVREAVARLKACAIKLQRGGLEKALGQLSVELDTPNVLGEERRARIQQALVLVDLALPRPIDVPGQRLVRERLIVQHLLAELSASHPMIAQALREDGVTSLERLSRLGAEELAERANVPLERAEQALSAFREYFSERARRGPELSLAGKTRALEQRLQDLESSAELFERVADDDDAGAKREARRRRQSDIARVSLYLAERGEATILGEIERCSVQGKIARLRRWLTEQPPSSARGAGVEPPKQETTG